MSAIPYLTAFFPEDLMENDRIYVIELGVDGEVFREGWIGRPDAVIPILRDDEGAYYYALDEGADGSAMRMYRTELTGEDEPIIMQLVQDVDLNLPTDLPSFFPAVGRPTAVPYQGGVALAGCGYYTYISDVQYVVGVMYSASPAGEEVVTQNIALPDNVYGWNGAVEFEDGSFSAFSWGYGI